MQPDIVGGKILHHNIMEQEGGAVIYGRALKSNPAC